MSPSLHGLTFSNPEKQWLLIQLNSDEVKTILASNAPRVVEYDAAGNPARSKMGRTDSDGAMKIVAAHLTKLYLEKFSEPFTEESDIDFKARKLLHKAHGITHLRKVQAETPEMHQKRVNANILNDRMYRWVCKHSPNKTKKTKHAVITETARSPPSFTAFSTFKASSKPAALDAAVSSHSTSSGTPDIGLWSSNIQKSFYNLTPEDLEELDREAERLNGKVRAGVPPEIMEIARRDKIKQIATYMQGVLRSLGEQTGWGGMVVLGGPAADGSGDIEHVV